MPMSEEFEQVFDVIREAADAEGLRSFRGNERVIASSLIDQIFESIVMSGLVVADLTGRNANVVYALGLAHSMGKRTVLLSQAAFRKGLCETGYVEGQNVTVEYHWLEGQVRTGASNARRVSHGYL